VVLDFVSALAAVEHDRAVVEALMVRMMEQRM